MVHRPLLLGHRGARATLSVPENTLASFDLAMEHGCDGFEFDVRAAACGTAVICHDPDVGKISVACSQASQLPNLPQLSQVMQRHREQAFLDIELKVENLESTVLAALRQFPPQRGYVVSSFLPNVVMELEARSESASIGIICENSSQLERWPKLPVDYVIVHHSLAEENLVRTLHQKQLKIMVWTVNDRDAMLHFAGMGVDGIISDETELLVRTLA